MTTLRDIASLAGVSTCTVSKILRGGTLAAPFSAPCRARVEAAAQRLGFVANRSARALRTGRTATIALAADWSSSIQSSYQGRLIAACEEAVRQHDSHLLLIGGEDSAETALAALAHQQCDGILLSGYHCSSALTARLRPHAAQVACWGVVPPGLSGAVLDEAAGLTAAVAHLASRGHRHVHYLGPAGHVLARRRAQAVAAAAQAHGLTYALLPLATLPGADHEAMALVEDALHGAPEGWADASAIVAFNDIVAFGAIAALRRMGRAVGELAVVGFDHLVPVHPLLRLTTIDPDLPALLAAAVRRLHDGGGIETITPRLVEGDTTARAPAPPLPPVRKDLP